MPPAWLDSFAAFSIGTALEQLLALDPTSRARTRLLSGRRLALTLDPGPIQVTLAFGTDAVVAEPGADDDADACIRLDPAAVARLITEGAQATAEIGAEVKGDANFASAVLDLLRGLRPDLLTPFGRAFGSEAAHVVGEAARRTGAEVRRGMDAGTARAREWLTAPADGWLPGRSEIARFLDEVDELRLATDRLEARIRRLETRSPPPGAAS